MSRAFNADDLHDILSETMRQVTDPKKPMELDRANTVANLADKMIKLAQTEVNYIKATESQPASGFFNHIKSVPALTEQK